MRIQAINTNTGFKGLFTDKTAQNGGNWRMEYQPYSWEKDYDQEIGRMANKAKFSIYDSMLPDNEEIFTQYDGNYKELSTDIYGTKTYYRTYDDRMRKTITQMPAMNREDSLKVANDKLDTFLDEKQKLRSQLEQNFYTFRNNAVTASQEYNTWSSEHEKGVFERDYNKSQSRYYMDQKKAKLLENTENLFDNSQKYIRLVNSIDAVKETKARNNKEINQLKELREAGKLIDISSRTAPNKNGALEAALQNIGSAAEKFICLPKKILSMQEIFKMLGPNHLDGKHNSEIIRYVENLITAMR